MEMRPLTVADRQALEKVRARRDSLRPHREATPPSVPIDWDKFFIEDTCRGWCALDGNRMIGTVFLHADPAHPDHAQISGLWLEDAYRGLGLGHDLLELAIHFAESHSYRWVKLWMAEANSAAASLYQAHGFRPTGRLRMTAYDPFLHVQQLVLELYPEPELAGLHSA